MEEKIDRYVGSFDGEKNEWLTVMVAFMRENFPEVEETIFYGMPAFRFDGQHIEFSVAKDHFTFHTLDFETIEELKALLPKAKFGRGSAKIRFSDREAMPVLFEASRRIVERWRAGRSSK